MTPEQNQVTSMLTSLKNELKKEYMELDGSDRTIAIYQAPLHVKDGEDCLKTELVYFGTTSIVIKSKETIGTWVAATMEV